MRLSSRFDRDVVSRHFFSAFLKTPVNRNTEHRKRNADNSDRGTVPAPKHEKVEAYRDLSSYSRGPK